jgi:hypothetical protein
MPDEIKPEPQPVVAVVKKDTRFKPGQSGNPLGRTPGSKAQKSKILSRFSRLWGAADAPDDWFGDSLKLMKKTGLTIDELIVIRMKYCLAANVKYQNPALVKEMLDRYEGKIPLTVRSHGEDGNDDFEEVSDEQLEAYIKNLDDRARAAHSQKQLPEDTTKPNATEVQPESVSGQTDQSGPGAQAQS